jgi:tetratricopeptide (TPR) repeat protein
MAEGIIGGILGDEDEKPEIEAPEALGTGEAFAAAVAAIASRQDPQVARDTSAFLRDQSDLLRVQKRHLEAEHALRLTHLRGQTRESKLRRAGMRLRFGFQISLALLTATVALGAVMLLWDAVTAHRVTIAAFEVSPALATRDLNGRIVASAVLDELVSLQAATRSSTEKTQLSSGWDGEIRLEVPEAGLSIGELSHFLRNQFGHDVRIEGDLVSMPAGGVVLSVRGTGIVPKQFIQPDGDPYAAARVAAEYIYGQVRPALWVAYLGTKFRNREAMEFAKAALGRTTGRERARLLDVWSVAQANETGDFEASVDLLREGLRVDPNDWGSHEDMIEFLRASGREEEAWRAGEMLRSLAGGRPGLAPEVRYNVWDQMTWNLGELLRAHQADLDTTAGAGTDFGPTWVFTPMAEALLHDPAAAEYALAKVPIDGDAVEDRFARHWARALIADERGDSATAAREWQNVPAGYRVPFLLSMAPTAPCYAAVALERTGQHAAADAALAIPGERRYVDCLRFRADIIDGRGDWVGAQRTYADSVAIAPDLPAGLYAWGMALVKHGDLEGGATKFRDANQRGPHWADPLKSWGDVLVKQGKPKDALAKYDEALKYAPNWKQLHEARDAVAKQKT